MYVRWKSQRYAFKRSSHSKAWYANDNDWRTYAFATVKLSAYLVESKRINGKPRQVTLAYLGLLNLSRIHVLDDWQKPEDGYEASERRNRQCVCKYGGARL